MASRYRKKKVTMISQACKCLQFVCQSCCRYLSVILLGVLHCSRRKSRENSDGIEPPSNPSQQFCNERNTKPALKGSLADTLRGGAGGFATTKRKQTEQMLLEGLTELLKKCNGTHFEQDDITPKPEKPHLTVKTLGLK